jgi:hypothetical protein
MQVQAVAKGNGADRVWPIVWRSVALAVVIFAVGVVAVFPGFVRDLVLPDQTVYAATFSEDRFGRVKPGMTEQEVLEILGRPLSISEHAGPRVYESNWAEGPSAVTGVEFRWWAYSKHGRLTDSYHVRAVKFSPDGKVLELLHRYHAD